MEKKIYVVVEKKMSSYDHSEYVKENYFKIPTIAFDTFEKAQEYVNNNQSFENQFSIHTITLF